ncbi:hypothetical protein Bsel_1619 [[Bacillus] selenitireducens MLS10]|uniref:Peptidyl-prolyl cis-trans isomerase n=2 Tax=Salisediminibacterium selenitireducens TaxID=85683 RepID=D6XTJ3_BACIE|nr:hypothetical protein Bsel_1619 [[Bacillus] selenitireducens MLS10]
MREKGGDIMSAETVRIIGNVSFRLTLDPGVWIFDDRRVHMENVFTDRAEAQVISEAEKMARAWNRQRTGKKPQSNQNIVHIDRKDLTEHSLGIPLEPFLQNASPSEDAKSLIVRQEDGHEERISLTEAMSAILAFSEKGKPLKETGPVHFYYGDGSNHHNPIQNVTELIVE